MQPTIRTLENYCGMPYAMFNAAKRCENSGNLKGMIKMEKTDIPKFEL
jgi:hypothetical protein